MSQLPPAPHTHADIQVLLQQLPGASLQVLYALREQGAMSQKEIRAYLAIGRTAVGNALLRLEGLELVTPIHRRLWQLRENSPWLDLLFYRSRVIRTGASRVEPHASEQRIARRLPRATRRSVFAVMAERRRPARRTAASRIAQIQKARRRGG